MAHSLSALPTEILILILYPLLPVDLAALARTCRRMHDLVYEFGWLQYSLANPRPSYSSCIARKQWSIHTSVRYDTLSDRAWDKVDFVARPLSRTWPAKEQSTLAITNSRLIVAAGTVLYSYSFHSGPGGRPTIKWEGDISLNETHVRGRNITSITFLEDGGLDQTLLVAYQEQLVERIHLIPPSKDGESPLSFTRHLVTIFPKGDYIESFSTSPTHLLSLSANGTVRLSLQTILTDDNATCPPPLEAEGLPPVVELEERSWKCHLSPSLTFAALGSTGKTPLTIYPISEDGLLSPTPATILHTERASSLNNLPTSAVYGISQAPIHASAWGSSPQVLASGWFDGRVRIYDLRTASSSSPQDQLTTNTSSSNINAPLLRPVMSLQDRWSTEPIYSISCGGGSGSQVAAGTARHSVVSFWDVRNPKDGWSVHAPGNDRSPVFSVILEGSRLFGTTELRPFVYDFVRIFVFLFSYPLQVDKRLMGIVCLVYRAPMRQSTVTLRP
ncbi:hypothetical protein EST38_g3381 [Candolleomyces aberdarensis]|uniref:F-box domain-containing protein n=1 Tax=Candolleomyces aberdarensis TaxID=2316362 RepID=A0A4Q2DU82_9AGAR|nr:hypothetical protein EST38_g3381 [Candolleomyces aberdarensis]